MIRPRALLALAALLLPCAATTAAAEEPTGEFRWVQTVEDLGEVVVPAATAGGWFHGPHGLRYRSVPSVSGDPTYELVLRAPWSGHPTRPERLLVQLPGDFLQKPFDERAVVFAFHSFSVSEKDVFLNTDLPHEARQRGWMLVAPFGLTEANFGNAGSQASLAHIALLLYDLVPFNYRRCYAVGFSMGGISALSFGMRHLDRMQLQFAGVVAHTPTLDMVRTFESSTLARQLVMAGPANFGATPDEDLFAYERVSPVRFQQDGLVDPDHAPVLNLAGRPVFLHANLADPNTDLLAGTTTLAQFLQQRGALVLESLVHEPAAGHSWSTLPLTQALDFIGSHELPLSAAQEQSFFVDTPGRWLQVEVDALVPDRVARFRLELAPLSLPSTNAFRLDGTRDLERITLRLVPLGLDPGAPLSFVHRAEDGSVDELALRGYAAAPSEVRRNGQSATDWTFDPQTGDLVLRPSTDGSETTIQVVP
jgi:predicted esterase